MIKIDIYEHEGRLIVLYDKTLERTTNRVAKELYAYSINPNLIRINRRHMRRARRAGYKVFVYKVLNHEDWAKAELFKVDGCFLDDPLVYQASRV